MDILTLTLALAKPPGVTLFIPKGYVERIQKESGDEMTDEMRKLQTQIGNTFRSFAECVEGGGEARLTLKGADGTEVILRKTSATADPSKRLRMSGRLSGASTMQYEHERLHDAFIDVLGRQRVLIIYPNAHVLIMWHELFPSVFFHLKSNH